MKAKADGRIARSPWLVFFVLVIAPLYASAVYIAIRSGLFSAGGTLTSEQLKAFWGFVGAGIAAAVTLAGALITRGQAERTDRRLKLDTTISGLGLLTNPDRTTYSPKAVVAGALSTLVYLDQSVIAVRALASAWKDDAIDAAAATWVLSRVFESGEPDTQLEAAILLNQQVPRLTSDTPSDYSWPMALHERWQPSLPTDARFFVLTALLKTLLSRPLSWWGENSGFLLTTLDEVVRTDSDDDVRGIAARTIGQLAHGWEWDSVTSPRGNLYVRDIARRASAVPEGAQLDELDKLISKIGPWLADGTVSDENRTAGPRV
jgi:hypothetical protein